MVFRVLSDMPELSDESLPSPPNSGLPVGLTGTADEVISGTTLSPTVTDLVMTTYEEVVGVGEVVSVSLGGGLVDFGGLVGDGLSDVLVGVYSSSVVVVDEDEVDEVEVVSSSEDVEEVGVSSVEELVGVSLCSSVAVCDGESVSVAAVPVRMSPICRRLGPWLRDPLTATARRMERRRIEKADDHRMMGDGNHRREKLLLMTMTTVVETWRTGLKLRTNGWMAQQTRGTQSSDAENECMAAAKKPETREQMAPKERTAVEVLGAKCDDLLRASCAGEGVVILNVVSLPCRMRAGVKT